MCSTTSWRAAIVLGSCPAPSTKRSVTAPPMAAVCLMSSSGVAKGSRVPEMNRHGVSIRSMTQEGLGAQARIIFITHVACERDMRATLDELRHLEAVRQVGSVLRVIADE